jgi:hypothetical protein
MSKPTQYEETLASELLERMAEGETLKSICADEHMPRQKIVRAWINGEYGAPLTLAPLYARARHHQADGFAADIISLADAVDDNAELAGVNAVSALPLDASPSEQRRAHFFAKKRSVEGAKLAIDARKWTAARMNPSRWGDKVTLEHSMDPDKPVRIDFTNMTTEQLERLTALEAELVARTTDALPAAVNSAPTNMRLLPLGRNDDNGGGNISHHDGDGAHGE